MNKMKIKLSSTKNPSLIEEARIFPFCILLYDQQQKFNQRSFVFMRKAVRLDPDFLKGQLVTGTAISSDQNPPSFRDKDKFL